MKPAALWILAILIMLAAVFYQRRTGPTYPYKGAYEIAGQSYSYKLVRSAESTTNARVFLPDPDGADFSATLHFKRYKTADSLNTRSFRKEDDRWTAALPKQPAAGKLAYFVTVSTAGRQQRIPAGGDEMIIIRFKDPVPGPVLVPHVVIMFFSILFGMRAGLGALFQPQSMRKWAIVALIGMTVGGMILGPIVQKYAFGEYWTGFPFGGDLTDNKMLIMWICWLVAAGTLWRRSGKFSPLTRSIVFGATLIMMIVYLIPHSLRGSELDYQKIDQGVPSKEAIGTGD